MTGEVEVVREVAEMSISDCLQYKFEEISPRLGVFGMPCINFQY